MIDLIIPVYNEAKNIKKVLDNIQRYIKNDKTVYIVYDFDQDDTLPVIYKIRDRYSYSIILLKNRHGRGVLNAIKTGFENAEDDIVLVTMADLSDRLEDVDKMVKKMNSGYDLICGSRYIKGGKQYGGPLLKKSFSRMAGLSLNILTGIPTHDVTNNYKMYRKSLLDSINIESIGGFELGIELTVKAYVKGYKIGEIPTKWFDRTEGKSNFHMWKWMPHYLKWYFYCIKHTWFKRRRVKC